MPPDIEHGQLKARDIAGPPSNSNDGQTGTSSSSTPCLENSSPARFFNRCPYSDDSVGEAFRGSEEDEAGTSQASSPSTSRADVSLEQSDLSTTAAHRSTNCPRRTPTPFYARRPVREVLSLKQNLSAREVCSEARGSTILSEAAEILGQSAPDAVLGEHMLEETSQNLPTVDLRPRFTPETSTEATPDTPHGPQQAESISQRRGQGKLKLKVVNGESAREQRDTKQRHPSAESPPSTCSTPLPLYSRNVEAPSTTDDSVAIRDLRKKLVMAYILQQQAQLFPNTPRNQEEGFLIDPSDPPPYLSAGEDTPHGLNEKSCPTRKMVVLDQLPPTPTISVRGLRPLLLPTHVAQRDSTTSAEHHKQAALRPLLLPRDVEERSSHELSAKMTFKTPPPISASVSACGPTSLEESFETQRMFPPMDESRMAHSTPKMSMLVIPLAGSIDSLASTYGTTGHGSSGTLSSQFRETLWLGAGTKSDWEVHLIGAYCIAPRLHC
ncbi:hypothetical protein PHLGIDRAFT_10959 [Phlebiopsis gigantea 11061_1 CR5-6]|uniref:Uncharacterized protein n=1 Tax=Phlebiopsis gigantea (strain 11061_1 CR5-6) TaxID=745531 RepID=A0A0C3S559_PHLG1|nr:hypothetical protein PHLGIDRAFT_10959 [Phlebiopsis gigantea 11061_1 CR5-6]